MREKIHDTCTCTINLLLFDRSFSIGQDQNRSWGPCIWMTLDGFLQRRSVTCRYHFMLSPTLSLMHSTCGFRHNEGERTTQSVLTLLLLRIAARFITRTCSFLSVFFSPCCPLFFIFPPPCPFFPSRTVVNGSSRVNFGGDALLQQNSKGDGGDFVCNTLHCVTSSFIPDFAADLRSEFTKTVVPLFRPTVCFLPFPSLKSCVLRCSFVLAFFTMQLCRCFKGTFVHL